MKNHTRIVFNAYKTRLQALNKIPDAAEVFSIDPSVEQTLEDKMRESSSFLQEISTVLVDEKQGEKLGLDIGPTVSSTKNTDDGPRVTSDPTSMSSQFYECLKTNFDTHLKYVNLDRWAKFPDFQARLANLLVQQEARERIMIGFNGTSHAANSNRAANPMLQDVNIGWLQHIRTEAPAQVMAGLKIGDQAGADYKNVDAAVMAAADEFIDEWHREATDLVAIIGRKLLSDKYVGLSNDASAPTEINALNTVVANKQVGGLKAVRVPYFPPQGILITRQKNLGIYTQEGSRRRHMKDAPEIDAVQNFQSSNTAYVVEDFRASGLCEDILVPDGAGGWQ